MKAAKYLNHKHNAANGNWIQNIQHYKSRNKNLNWREEMLTIKYLTLDGNISSITFQVQAMKNRHI
jgi:hypothetical protein